MIKKYFFISFLLIISINLAKAQYPYGNRPAFRMNINFPASHEDVAEAKYSLGLKDDNLSNAILTPIALFTGTLLAVNSAIRISDLSEELPNFTMAAWAVLSVCAINVFAATAFIVVPLSFILSGKTVTSMLQYLFNYHENYRIMNMVETGNVTNEGIAYSDDMWMIKSSIESAGINNRDTISQILYSAKLDDSKLSKLWISLLYAYAMPLVFLYCATPVFELFEDNPAMKSVVLCVVFVISLKITLFLSIFAVFASFLFSRDQLTAGLGNLASMYMHKKYATADQAAREAEDNRRPINY